MKNLMIIANMNQTDEMQKLREMQKQVIASRLKISVLDVERLECEASIDDEYMCMRTFIEYYQMIKSASERY